MPADVPALIRQILKARGMKQNALAKKLDVSQGTVSKWLSGAHIPEALEYEALKEMAAAARGSPGDRATAVIDGRRVSHNITPGAIPEIDTTLGAGGGGYPLPEEITDGGRRYSADAVRDEWIFPERFTRDELRLQLSHADIIPVRGNSMETHEYGGFRDGDRVLVDRRDKNIRQGGIFAIRDYDETIIKQVELIRGTDPPRIRCVSLNKSYEPAELILDGSAEIIGRVVLKISRT